MSFFERWKRFAQPSIAFAFEREQVWSVDRSGNSVTATAACVATDRASRKVTAVGDAAVRLRGAASEQLIVTDYIREGGIDAFEIAEAAVRMELRRRLAGRWHMPPRVLVATRQNEIAKRAVRDVMLHAGSRDVVTIPQLMAGAIGAGLDVGSARPTVVFMLDRDWAGFAVVQSNKITASHEAAGGIDQMLEDVAARARVGAQAGPGLDVLHAQLKASGLGARDADAGHGWFVRRWQERFLQTVQSSPAAVRAEINRAPFCLIGPYAKTPGLLEMFASAWQRTAISGSDPERAVIHGCRKVFDDLDFLIKSAK